jgi:MiaB/RimO family radical SAM methylthiotransferase
MPYAYVKVAEGCDKPCTFCAIPLIRGKQRSRPASNVIAEVEALSRAGVSEVILVAQDLASYGRDRDSAENILELLQQVSAVPEVRSIRLLYLYPKEIRPALIDEVTANPKIASYFDLSLQHASTRLLRTMKRPGSAERHLELIDSIRRADQSAALRSSFIVGFPGETEEEVEELANFLEAARLDWAGFFTYSAEEGTAAASLGGRISRRETAERQRHLQGIQEEITAAANLEQVGRTYSAIVDQIEEGVPVSRSYRQAPEIDGVITLDRGRPGEWVEVEIVSALGTDLEGKVRG